MEDMASSEDRASMALSMLRPSWTGVGALAVAAGDSRFGLSAEAEAVAPSAAGVEPASSLNKITQQQG